MRIILSAIVLFMALNPGLAQAQRLSDADRDPFVDAGRASCITTEKNSPGNRPFNFRHSQIAVFCECKMQLMADTFTTDEIMRIAGRDIDDRLRDMVVNIVKKCAQVMPIVK